MNDSYHSEKPKSPGLPAVSHFAEALFLSANYFGDLIKRETGQTAKDYIQIKIIEPDKNINEVSYEMGFKYPQHFTRLFKRRVGVTPNEYKQMN